MCLGHVAGALVGTTYPDRAALREAGIHRENQAGITGLVRRSAEAVGIRGAGDRDARRWARRHRAWDLNDGTEAATTQVLYGPPGSQPRGPEDATLVSGAFQRADTLDGQRLFNVTKLVPEALRWSRRFNGQNELLDHILASEGLMPRLGQLRQVPVVTIYNEDTPTLVGTNPTVTGSFLTTPR